MSYIIWWNDETKHTWNPTCIYIYIKPLRPDPIKQSNMHNQILGYDNTMGSGL